MLSSKTTPPPKEKTKRVKTPSFVVELPLRTTNEDERLLNDRLMCASRLYNTLLQEGIELVDVMRAEPDWSTAKNIKDKVKKAEAYQSVKEKTNFSKSHFEERIAFHAKAANINKRVGSHEMQALAKRVFEVLSKWIYAKGGKPRFKSRKRMLHSIEGKNNDGMLRWYAETKEFQVQRDWRIPVILPKMEKNEWVWTALQSDTKYCRVVWRNINGVKRWYLQLVQQGLSPIKARHLEARAKSGTKGGIDLGPSNIAWCTETQAGLQRLCPEIERSEKLVRILQRKIDRQRREANPQNFNANGTIKKGKKSWVISSNQRKTEIALANLQRIEAATRQCSHGQLINFFLSKALDWKDDGVSPKALQKQYGKSVGKRAPGMLMAELTRKAERAGGSRTKIDIRNLKTSQYDHTTDTFLKKKLSERWHLFRDCRGKVQRDVYSAFLALHSEGSKHNSAKLETAWQALESTLSEAGLCEVQSARGSYANPREHFHSRQSAPPAIPETCGLSAA